MMDFSRILLLGLLVVPLAGAVAAALLGPDRRDAVRKVSLGATLLSAAFAFILAAQFVGIEGRSDAMQTFRPEVVPGASASDPHTTSWNLLPFGSGNVQFYVGLDGLNVWLVALTALLMVPSVLVSWNAIEERANEYYAWLLALGGGMVGVFLSFDVVLFYVFFELTLVPLFFLIGIWGGPQRQYAARKFFIYTLAGSLVTLVGVLAV